jgi:hypothetical protein
MKTQHQELADLYTSLTTALGEVKDIQEEFDNYYETIQSATKPDAYHYDRCKTSVDSCAQDILDFLEEQDQTIQGLSSFRDSIDELQTAIYELPDMEEHLVELPEPADFEPPEPPELPDLIFDFNWEEYDPNDNHDCTDYLASMAIFRKASECGECGQLHHRETGAIICFIGHIVHWKGDIEQRSTSDRPSKVLADALYHLTHALQNPNTKDFEDAEPHHLHAARALQNQLEKLIQCNSQKTTPSSKKPSSS